MLVHSSVGALHFFIFCFEQILLEPSVMLKNVLFSFTVNCTLLLSAVLPSVVELAANSYTHRKAPFFVA